jgi:predicted MFS family arabinose efflux permease
MDAGTIIVAALVASSIGALFYNLLPLYLGSAQDYRGLDNRDLGFLSAAFFLGYNIVTITAFFWIRRIRWGAIVAVAAPIAVLGLYAGTVTGSYGMLLVTVAVAGGAFAAIYGVGTTILGDTSNPGRWYGIKIALEALTGAVLLLVLPATAIARWGFDGAVFGLIIAIVFLSPCLFWIPARGTKGMDGEVLPLDVPDARGGGNPVQTPYIWGAIIATLVFFSGASAIWAFIERIGAQGNHDAAAVGLLLAVTLVFAVLGSLVAAALGGRFGNVLPFLAGSAAFLGGLVALGDADSFSSYALGACAVTFAIGYMLPIALTEIAELDIDGRYVVLSVPAIGIGAMVGPAIAGILTRDGGYLPLLVFGAATVLVASVLIAASAAHARQSVALQTDTGD